MKTKKPSTASASATTAENLEARFDAGDAVLDYFDTDNATRTVNLDLPAWAIAALDREAKRRAIARQALIKGWLVDRLDELREKRAG